LGLVLAKIADERTRTACPCSLEVSLFPTQDSLEMTVLQGLLTLLCPLRIRKCRQTPPLLLTLLLTMANVSIPGPAVVKWLSIPL
jgi:hypothetical protein